MQASIPLIMQLLDQVHSGQQQLLQLWQIKKVKLDQCLQLRLFEQDCDKVLITTFSHVFEVRCLPIYHDHFQMFDWIFHNRELFSKNYVTIGSNFIEAKQLQDEHNHFTMGSNVKRNKLYLAS